MRMKKPRKGVALALSGGGFRATLFHAGALIRLNELGLLKQINRFVSVSGGAIALGCLAMNWPRLDWKDGRATNLKEVFVEPLQGLCRRKFDIPAILEGVLKPSRPPSEVLRRAYTKHIFGDLQLDQLPSRPMFLFQATNLATGRAFRFTRDYVADYLIGSAPSTGISLATAVAASTAFPPVLSPLYLKIDAAGFKKLPGSLLHDREEFRKNLKLTDGGVYDNLALEPAWDSETVLVSDAGAPFEHSARLNMNWYRQYLRALDIASTQARALRKRWLVDQFASGTRKGAYWGITTDISRYPVKSVKVNPGIQEKIYTIRTRLNCFSSSEQGQLINLGYALSDAACRSHMQPLPEVPFIFPETAHSIV